MLANRLAFAALAVACMGAAAGGGYLASRQSSAPVSAAVSAPGSASSSTAKPVQETEAIVGDTAGTLPAVTPPASPSASVTPRRADPARATQTARATQPRSSRLRSADPLPALDRTW